MHEEGERGEGQEEGTAKRKKPASEGGDEEGGAAAAGAAHPPVPPDSGKEDGCVECSADEDEGCAASEGTEKEVTCFEVCHEVLGSLGLLRVMLEHVGDGHFIFVAGACKVWRTQYTALYPATETNFSSMVSSVERMEWATRHGLELSENVFDAAVKHGDVHVCKALHGKGCPWNDQLCGATATNKEHGLSIVQWLEADELGENGPSGGSRTKWPWPYDMCAYAAEEGNLEMLEWLLDENGGNYCMGSCTWQCACTGGHIPIVEFLLNYLESGAAALDDEFPDLMVGHSIAAERGHLEVLQLLHAKAPNLCEWDTDICSSAVMAKSLATLKWLRSEQVQCPWDARSCPQVIRDNEIYENKFDGEEWDISDAAFKEMKQWVHAHGHPCACED